MRPRRSGGIHSRPFPLSAFRATEQPNHHTALYLTLRAPSRDEQTVMIRGRLVIARSRVQRAARVCAAAFVSQRRTSVGCPPFPVHRRRVPHGGAGNRVGLRQPPERPRALCSLSDKHRIVLRRAPRQILRWREAAERRPAGERAADLGRLSRGLSGGLLLVYAVLGSFAPPSCRGRDPRTARGGSAVMSMMSEGPRPIGPVRIRSIDGNRSMTSFTSESGGRPCELTLVPKSGRSSVAMTRAKNG